MLSALVKACFRFSLSLNIAKLLWVFVKEQSGNLCLCLLNFRFCFECIDNWSTIMNLCPLCQREFQLITCVPVRCLIFVFCFVLSEHLS